MTDPRLEEIRQALQELEKGNYTPKFEVEGDDSIARLGKTLREVGESLRKKERQQQLLESITTKINSGFLLEEILDHVFDSFHELLPYDRIGIALIDESGKTVTACCSRSRAADIKIAKGYRASLSGSSLEKIIKTGQPRILNDLEQYYGEHPQSVSTRLILEEGMRSSLTCPLIAQNRAVGFIFFSSFGKKTYRDLHVDTFLKIAENLSIILEKSRMYGRLIELNELKNKFLGIAAHDLRSPIGVIKNFIILFLNDYLGEIDTKQREVLTTMDKNCDRMLNLINNFLDFSTIESGNLELALTPVDLYDFFTKYKDMTRQLAEKKNIRLKMEIQETLPRLTIDEDRITQVLDNLVTNAIKFSYPDTTVTIQAQSEDGRVKIAVADQGQGIPKHEITKIFKEFSKTSVKPTGGEKSTGLGLAIAKRIIEAHHGTIEVQSKVGKGTTFTIRLPVHQKK